MRLSAADCVYIWLGFWGFTPLHPVSYRGLLTSAVACNTVLLIFMVGNTVVYGVPYN